MLKQAAFFLFAILVMVTIFVAGEHLFSPIFKECVAKDQQSSANSADEKQPQGFGATVASYIRCTTDFVEINDKIIVAIATIVIAAFTGTLWVATSRQAELTARAVKVSERALTDLERPYLFILDYNWILRTKVPGLECGFVYSVANGGKLPAFIKGVKLGIRFGESIPPIHDEPPVHDLLTAPLIGGGEQRQVIQGFTSQSDEAAVECQIRGGQALIPGIAFKVERVIAKISIEYDGPITTGHTTTACWEWHPVKHAFTQYGGPEHNQRT